MDRFLILCAGEMRRWGNHLGVAKHLVEIDGIPLVDRTISLLRENGAVDIVIVSATASMERAGAELAVVKPDTTGTAADKFLSSRHLWSSDGTTHILFGDVWFSDHALASIVGSPLHTRFLGRLQGSSVTGCEHGEIFAVSVPLSELASVDDALAEVRTLGPERPGVVAGWSLYGVLLERQNRGKGAGVSFLHIDDFTEDFDSPADYEAWVRARNDPTRTRQKAAQINRRRRRRARRLLLAILMVAIGSVLTVGLQLLI